MTLVSRSKLFAFAISALSVPLIQGCATIVHGGPRNVPVASVPTGAAVTIYDRNGTEISRHTTPFVAKLSTKHKYFSGQSYKLVFEMEGYAKQEIQLQPKVSGWYFSNLLFGGIIGMLIVDPLTGAMYNLSPNKIEQNLSPATAEQVRRGETLLVILKSQATPGELSAMTPVEPKG